MMCVGIAIWENQTLLLRSNTTPPPDSILTRSEENVLAGSSSCCLSVKMSVSESAAHVEFRADVILKKGGYKLSLPSQTECGAIEPGGGRERV